MSEHESVDRREPEEEEPLSGASPGSTAIADSLVLGQGRGAELAPETASYLSAQTRLLSVQLEHMHEQRILQLEHLRVRRWRERLEISLQLLLWGVAACIIAGVVGIALWARNDESMVIEPFKTPPGLSSQGLDGTVLAAKLLDGVTTLQEDTGSARAPSTMKGANQEEIKLEIPETGVSVGELLKYLAAWLGHETHVTGEVYFDNADTVVTVRAGEASGVSFRGPREQLDQLMAKASEAVFARTQPYLYAVYLNQHGRKDESLQAARALAISGPAKERGWAYAHWANLLLQKGDNAGAALRAGQALAHDDRLWTAQNNLASAEWNLGHEETAYQARRRALALLQPGKPETVTAAAAAQYRVTFKESVDEARGDYQSAAALSRQQLDLPDYAGDGALAEVFLADDLAEDHDAGAAQATLAKAGLGGDAQVLRYLQDSGAHSWPYADNAAAVGDWAAAAADLEAADAWMTQNEPTAVDYRVRRLEPELARALAESGRLAQAQALLDKTPRDCNPCLRARGRVAALQGKAGAADGWFKQAVATAPSLPRAYLDWGEALLARGDSAAAASQAAEAVRRGPHFADAYVLWAGALMQSGDAAAAERKLAAGAAYAPAWGRLHLLWGEALAKMGRRPDAEAQWRQAGSLALSAGDHARLTQDLGGQ